MLVRAGDGEWLQLRPLEDLPSGGFRALCGQDAANLLEIDEPMPVVAFGEQDDQAMVDAICLLRDGGIALLAATFGERADSTLWRLMNVAGTLRGMSFELFSANCAELRGASPSHWLAERVGGDAGSLEARMRDVLEQGSFELVLVTTDGPGELATPMRFLQQGPANVRVYEIELMRAGDVQAVEGAEVTLDGERAEPRRTEVVQAAPAPVEPEWQEPEAEAEVAPEPEATAWQPEAVFEQAAEVHRSEFEGPQLESYEPEPEVEAIEEAEPEAEQHEEPEAEQHEEPAAAAEPAPRVATEVEPEPLGEPSDKDSFAASLDKLDHKSSAHMHFLHERLLTFVGDTEYTRDDKLEYFVGWTREAQPRPLVGLDSAGSFTVVLSSLPQEEQAEYAAELASLAPEGDGSQFMELGVAELSVPEHLNDQTLLEYVLDNLQEALPGGRELFASEASSKEQPAGRTPETEAELALANAADSVLAEELDAEDVGDDFFAGVSADHDPGEVAEVTGEPAPQAEQPAPAPAAQEQKKGGFARRLRRRDAA